VSAPFVAETTFRVRYAETDAQGIVHHASYVVYFEEGRSDYTRQRGSSYADFEREGFFLAVTELQVRYARAARYDDRLTVRTWIREIRSRSLTFQYAILQADSGETLVTATSHHICLSREGKVARIPPRWLQWMEQ
jgi:acyl-CoA thioester hydrolase